jgi:hypothetical protein
MLLFLEQKLVLLGPSLLETKRLIAIIGLTLLAMTMQDLGLIPRRQTV